MVPYTKRSFIVPFVLVSTTFFIGHFAGMTTLQTYSVQIFQTLKAPMDKYYATLLLGIVEVLGALVCISLIHYTGKRPLTFISTIGCGICFGLTATYAYFLPNISNEPTFIGISENPEEKNKYAWIPLTLLLGSALLSHSGIRLLPWILIGEVFPSKVRAAGAGFASGMGYMFGFLANKLFLQMLSTFKLTGTFWIYSVVAIVGTVILYKILPETEGRTLLVCINFNKTFS